MSLVQWLSMQLKFMTIGIQVLILLSLAVCSLKKPTSIDGTMGIKLIAIDTTGVTQTGAVPGNAPVADARVRLFSTEYNLVLESQTNEQGEVTFCNLLASHYRITVDKLIPAGARIINVPLNKDGMLQGSLDVNIYQSGIMVIDTVKLGLTLLSDIVINEIYYCGPAGTTYYDDQFVELYNASNSIQYLDGLIIGRAANSPDHIGHKVVVTIAYQFPGNGADYPVAPGEFILIAKTAINHSIFAKNAPDLSKADWECFNQLAKKNNDQDNSDVKNLININPNQPNDFSINLTHNAVFLLKVDHQDNIPMNQDGFMLFEISQVIDGVEYCGNINSQKQIDSRIDAGFAGLGIEKYSGKSIERENPINGAAGYDINNSTLDFVTLSHPTPDSQHTQRQVLKQVD